VTTFRGLHDYQQDVVDGAVKLWRAGRRRIAAVMATGAGKTFTFSVVARMVLEARGSVLVLAHRKELLAQAIGALTAVNPGARVGLMKGSVKQHRADIVVASVATASNPGGLALLKLRNWSLIIVDECHHGTAASYVRILEELGAYRPDGPLVLGVTATLDRADGQALGQVFEEVIDPQVALLDLIRRGFLVPPRGIRVKIAELDLDRIRRTAGDFNSGALGRAMSDAMAPKRIVEAYLEHCGPDTPGVAFLPTVAFSIEQAEAFNAAGIPTAHLDGTAPDDVRDKALEDFRAGRIRMLCNVGLFLEGTDLPSIRVVILGRPTSSTTVYVQQVGRGLRTDPDDPGKTFCWVLDVCGVTRRHRLANMANLGGADAPEETPEEFLMYEEDLTDGDEPGDDDGEADSPADVDYADGDLEHEMFDLFGASDTAWLRTNGGTWFVPAGAAGFLYLDRAGPDTYQLHGVTPAGQRHTLTGLLPLQEAMQAGDRVVEANPIWQADKAATWRHTRAHGGMTRGEAWDAKAVVRASALIDHR